MKKLRAIVNLRTSSTPIEAIRYFNNVSKVSGVYNGLALGTTEGSTPDEMTELLLADHHDRRAKRVCRTAVISVETPNNASQEELLDCQRTVKTSQGGSNENRPL